MTALVAADVPASFINSQQSRAEVSAVFRELNKSTPSCKLLYITPEQFVKSSSLQSLLTGLHRRGLLARLVIDEVAFLVLFSFQRQTLKHRSICMHIVHVHKLCRITVLATVVVAFVFKPDPFDIAYSVKSIQSSFASS